MKKICGLLTAEEHLRKCGAALVLAELKPKDPAVIKALGTALEGAGPVLTACILDAFQSIGSKKAVPYAMRLLNAEDVDVRMRAIATVAMGGTAVAPEIKKSLEHATRGQKRIFADILARIPRKETYQILLNMLFDRDFEVVKEVCGAVHRHVESASNQERLVLHKTAAQFARNQKVQQSERVLTSCLLMLGNIGRKEAAMFLLKYTVPKYSPYIRKHALVALKSLAYTAATATSVANKATGYLNDSDEEVVRHSADLLRRLPLTTNAAARWKKLLTSPHPSVRIFAARQLSDLDTSANCELLISLLDQDNTEIVDVAATALSRHKKALPLLLARLATEKDHDSTWRLVRILKPHSDKIDNKTIARFQKLTAKEMLSEGKRRDPLLYFLRNISETAAEGVLLESGLAHKKAKRWPEAVQCLRRLIHTETFNPEISYALSVCDLKISRKDLSPRFREDCHALRGFNSLYRQDRNTLRKKLTADRSLDASDLYYVGFHFREGPGDQREYGESLLTHVVDKWPKSKEAKAVRTQLKITRAVKRAPTRKATPKKKSAKKERTKTKKKAAPKKKSAGRKKAAARKTPRKTTPKRKALA